MICQECGKRLATLHFTKIVNGDKTEYHICEVCAKEKGELIPGGTNAFSIHNLLSGLLDFTPNVSGMTPRQAAPRCETCGLTYSQFSKLGRFGCSDCYKYFDKWLDPMLKKVHGSTVHVGKVPKRVGGSMRYKREIEQLKKEMAMHIEREEFEQAALIRDRIKELEKKLH